MIELLYCFISKLVELFVPQKDEEKWTRLWQLLIFLSFPYALMGTAGWMTTTIVYTWTFALYAFALYIILSASEGRRISPLLYILYGMALMFAANFNVTAISLLLIYLFMYIGCKKNKAFYILFMEGMVIIVFNLILFIVAPGNKSRMANDAIYHNTADLMELSFFHKLRMGINSTFYHFVSVPNVILFVTCLVLFAAILKKSDKLIWRVVGGIPLILDTAWTCYIFLAYTLRNRQLTYIYPDGAFVVCPELEQYLAMASAVIMIVCMLCGIGYVTDFGRVFWIATCCIILFGLLPEIALGFTTTVSASIIRMSTFFYLALILCSDMLVTHCNLLRDRMIRNGLFMIGIVGGILNIFQVIRHILVYG